ncbi:methylenetetrahydrofolate reductase [NAD(P)H] [Ampullimonas aquatilis]
MTTQQRSSNISFEFFPPKTDEGKAKLRDARITLARFAPRFFSVTFGAGGSTQDRTLETVIEIQQSGIEAAPHLSCVGSTRDNIRALLKQYQAQGIRRIVALRGDLPSGMGISGGVGELRYANELVEFIRAETGDWFHIEVACYPEFHPQAKSAQDDLKNFERKAKAGASSAITQYFFNSDAYFRFVDEVAAMGVNIPIVPGIMPITNHSQLARFSDMCGADIPRWIKQRLMSYGDDLASIRAFGLDVVTDLCDQLLSAGAPGLHFYTLNNAGPSSIIWERLQQQSQ